MNYRVFITDRDSGRRFDLCVVAADTSTDAVRKAQLRFKSMFKRFETQKIVADAEPTGLAPTTTKRVKRADATLHLEV